MQRRQLGQVGLAGEDHDRGADVAAWRDQRRPARAHPSAGTRDRRALHDPHPSRSTTAPARGSGDRGGRRPRRRRPAPRTAPAIRIRSESSRAVHQAGIDRRTRSARTPRSRSSSAGTPCGPRADDDLAALVEARVDARRRAGAADLVDGVVGRLLGAARRVVAVKPREPAHRDVEVGRAPRAVAARRPEPGDLALDDHDPQRRIAPLEVVRGPQARQARRPGSRRPRRSSRRGPARGARSSPAVSSQ